ncbi:MAG TPA: hypothetical protein VFK38_07255 [Candidatus Limnocylindrales bacterium]|nr:hypothetical protein [Candidatus Limnocylindrales bacterium]
MNDVSDTPASSQPTPDPTPQQGSEQPTGYDRAAGGPNGEEDELEEVKKRVHPFD